MFYVITLTGARGAVKLQCMSDAAAPSRKPRDAYHHGGLRDALVDAAIQAAEAGGPEAVSFSALARALGVTQAAPYRHFADRDELAHALRAAVPTVSVEPTSLLGVTDPDEKDR